MSRLSTEIQVSDNPAFETALESLLQAGIAIPSRSHLAQFQREHAPILTQIVQALERARQLLPYATLSLEPYTDPETGETLWVIYARFPAYDENVLQNLEEAQRTLESSFSDVFQRLLLTTDFKTPDAVSVG